VAARTQVNIEGRLRNHILPEFGDQSIQTIRPSDVRAWISRLSNAGLRPGTVKATYQTFAQIMRTAEIDRVISRSPCVGIDLPKEISREETLFLTAEDVDRLAQTIDPRFQALIYTAAYAGLRAGELGALKVDDVDTLRGTIKVTKSVTEVRGRLVTGPTRAALFPSHDFSPR
jgi:integrase